MNSALLLFSTKLNVPLFCRSSQTPLPLAIRSPSACTQRVRFTLGVGLVGLAFLAWAGRDGATERTANAAARAHEAVRRRIGSPLRPGTLRARPRVRLGRASGCRLTTGSAAVTEECGREKRTED